MQFGNSIAPQGWQQLSLEDICLKITSGGTPNRKNPDFYNNGEILWVKTKELNNYFIYDTEEKITKDALNKSSAKLLPKDTILLAMYGVTVGELGILSKEMACNQACCALIINPKIADFRFVFYLLKLYKENIKGLATGAAQQNLSATTVKGFTFNFPPLVEQQEIADFLFGIDAKIQLNTQTNQTLEQIAQTIYKSWFVEYEPTRAKAAVLATGGSKAEAETAAMTAISGKTAAELAAAFPAALVPTDDFGEIPEGWEVKYLKDVCKIVYGKGLPTSKLQEKGFPVFGGNGVIGYYKDYLYKEPKTLISCRGAASGKVIYSLPYSFVTNNSLVIENKGSGLESFYIYESLRLQNLADLASGSAQPQITISNMNPVRILIPSNKVCNFYSEKIKSIYEKMYEINKESELLSNLRDIILPKLLNGELKQE